ncbi:murein biosynthesis integral membrane protein MurJ [Nocardioides yefusunii]|uniref:Murein biosynthesis integral membrane protein MurJ n=1 Tax=Nocardioides yefusunii TaxID=2500546 RepID=A0ABW1QZA7_9ACTN|nr:murein biosynthesis integral membrane protein MurJ [Nocardioides yefusunii]
MTTSGPSGPHPPHVPADSSGEDEVTATRVMEAVDVEVLTPEPGQPAPHVDDESTSTHVDKSTKQSILASSAVMAVGTVFSRFSGVIRSILLAAALGSVGVAADAFQVANTIPNMLYILLAGGVFNAVLVPQLVRSLKNDDDGGQAYTDRIMTLALLFLGAVTLLLVALAPLLLKIFLSPQWYEADMSVALDRTVTLARWCLPQVFFYGMFTLVGQVLNARGSFGPMMWAPIANNVISVVMLVSYLVAFGPVTTVPDGGVYSTDLAYTAGEMALLGGGSTLGIVVQLLVLVPFLRKAGYRFRPRFDFRGTGLRHTAKLAVWTVLFIVVNQIAYTVVVRLLSGETAEGLAGQTVYANSYMIMLLPHGVITVSLVTALLPRLSAQAAGSQHRDLALTLTSTLRTALVVTLPFAAILAVVGTDIGNVLYGYGASKGSADAYGPTLTFFGVALVFFTLHYFMLRGFYALEQTRTVFLIQLVVGTVNVVAAITLVHALDSDQGAGALAAAYALAYAAGALVSWFVLRRTLGGLDGSRMIRYAVRMLLAVGIALAVATAVWWAFLGWKDDPAPALSLVRGGVVGVVHLVVYYVLTRLFRITEVSELVDPVVHSVRRRLKRR